MILGYMLDHTTESDPGLFTDADLYTSLRSTVIEQVKIVGINPEYSLFGGVGG